MKNIRTLFAAFLALTICFSAQARGFYVQGRITDAHTGKGIAGVPVTDGYNYVKTDAAGRYRISPDSRALTIYYTTPSAYRVALDSERHLPSFYKSIVKTGKRQIINFAIEPLPAGPETDFTIIMIGDPQCTNAKQAARYQSQTVADITSTATECPGPVYAVTLGDITFDSSDMWERMAGTMSNISVNGEFLPFFQCMGNHDHDSLQDDTDNDADDDYRARGRYVSTFGPADYSFDRGNVHIVVMDDIIVSNIAQSSKPNKKTWKYDSGFTDEQYEWLKQDIACVEHPEEKMLIFCCHSPFRGAGTKNLHHQGDILKLMTSFKECHIMSGHTHTQQNVIQRQYVTAGGTPIYEHIHGTACGAWWTSNSNLCGTPCGYNVYSVEGPNVVSWRFKGTNRDANYQLRVYDGSQIYGGKNIEYSWTAPETKDKSGTVTVGMPEADGRLVAEVFDDDDANWKVELWIDGVKSGDFIRKKGNPSNVPLAAFWHNVQGRDGKHWRGNNVPHFWYCDIPGGLTPSELENSGRKWEVRAIFTVPTHKATVHTYSCSRITRDYSEF